ncbi:MAG: alpha/beta fold hydrolase [Gaiellaceae bacterium]
MQLHVHQWGADDAPPLVCLHGVTGHGRRFRRLAEERLAAGFRVIAPDLRGHGRSEWEPPWRLETYVADLVETLDDLGTGPGTFVGHSFGGRLLLELAEHAPERVERAVLLDPAIQILPHIALSSAEDIRRDRVFDSIEEAIADRIAGDPTNPREFVEEEMLEHLTADRDGRLRPRYSQACVAALYGELATEPPAPETLRARTLLVHAPGFGLVRAEQVSDYAAALGDRLRVVEVAGGHMVYWDAYTETADAIDAFLAR